MSQEIPDKIYLQFWHEDGELSHWPTWCVDRIHDTDILYTQSDPERLRLLEAVAIAARANARKYLDLMDGEGMTFAEYLVAYPMRPHANILEALAALQALDEKEQL